MALNIDTSALQTLKAFNEFAAVMGSDSKAVAAVEVGKDGQIQVRLDYGDKAYALKRSNEQKQINRTVRDTLADAVAKLFNGADNVPESVAKELRLSDHAAGKPLTALSFTVVAQVDNLNAIKIQFQLCSEFFYTLIIS